MFSTSSFTQNPDFCRLILVFLIGVLLAALANYCVDRLGWVVRYRSPWRRFPKELSDKGAIPALNWRDRIPIWGWLAVSRFAFANNEDGVQKKGSKRAGTGSDKGKTWKYAHIPGWESRFFWVRPFFVEILFALLVVWRHRYWSSVGSGDAFGLSAFLPIGWVAETVLFWLALCSSLVDLDDYVIPDFLMIPGVLLGLGAAVFFPALTTPIAWPLDWTGEKFTFSVCEFASRLLISEGAEASLSDVRVFVGGSLTLAWSFWAFALLDRRFYSRLGFKRAFAIFWRRLRRSPLTPIVGAMWTAGLVVIWKVAFLYATRGSSDSGVVVSPLDSLTVSMVGLLVGTVLIWSVRLVGGAALGVEAMGFGDVILSGVIGSFIGWQGVVVVFFVAPFFGLIFGMIRRCFNSAREIPYGPFLCLGTATYAIWREQFDLALKPYFSDPLFTFGLGLFGLVLLGGLLAVLRFVKGLCR